MKKVYAAGALFWSSIILLMGAMGGIEWETISFGQAYIYIALGLIMMLAAVPLSKI